MFATVHSASALLIATKISNPWSIFFIGIISHYLIDLIPHGDRALEEGLDNKQLRTKKIKQLIIITIVDLFLSLLLLLFFLSQKNWFNWQNIFIAYLAVLLPDILMGFGKISLIFKLDNPKNLLIKLNLKLHRIHLKIHNFFPSKMNLSQGITLQIIITLTFIILAF